MVNSVSGQIFTPQGWITGTLDFDQRITSVRAAQAATNASPEPCRSQGNLVVPGFIDLHVHGGAGRDVMQGGDAIDCLAKIHARHGTTALLATTMTAPVPEIEAALQAVADAMAAAKPGAATVLGVHLEGPFLNRERLGAQPDFVTRASHELIDRWCRIARLRVVTLAPELDPNMQLIGDLVARGIRVQIGHSAADYDTARAAMLAGSTGFTHLFNAMSGMHHREPGVVAAALAHAEFAEIIPDLLHVHPGVLRAAARAIPGLYAVTDGTAASGMADGEYRLGRQWVHKCAGGVRLADGTLAGSALTMDVALGNLVKTGLTLTRAVRMVSTGPADYLGLEDRGRLQRGAWADLVVLDQELRVTAVFAQGVQVDIADAA